MDKIRTYSNINKRFNSKGITDYRIILFVVGYSCCIYQIMDYLNINIINIIYTLLLSLIPLLGIYFTVSKEDDIVAVLLNIARYLVKPKIYVYMHKSDESEFKKYSFNSSKYSCKNK